MRKCEIKTEFDDLGNFRAHVRRLHLLANNEQQGDVHRCVDCSAVFRNVSSLTSHMSKFHCDGIQVCTVKLIWVSLFLSTIFLSLDDFDIVTRAKFRFRAFS